MRTKILVALASLAYVAQQSVKETRALSIAIRTQPKANKQKKQAKHYNRKAKSFTSKLQQKPNQVKKNFNSRRV